MTALFRIIAGLAGAVIAIESLALFVGMRLAGEEAADWIRLRNELFVLFDVLVGALLIYVAMKGNMEPWPALYYALVGLSLVAHGYRAWEWVAGLQPSLFFDVPPLVFTGFRFAGLGPSAVIRTGSRPDDHRTERNKHDRGNPHRAPAADRPIAATTTNDPHRSAAIGARTGAQPIAGCRHHTG